MSAQNPDIVRSPDGTPNPAALRSPDRLRAVLADVEARVGGFDPESTQYLRGVRDTLRVILGDAEGQTSAAALFFDDIDV